MNKEQKTMINPNTTIPVRQYQYSILLDLKLKASEIRHKQVSWYETIDYVLELAELMPKAKKRT